MQPLDMAQPVPVRLVVRPRSYLHETLLLLHLPRLAIVLALATVGTFLAPAVALERYAALLGFLALGVGLGAYRLDELHDRTTAPGIPARHHRAIGALGLAAALAIALGTVAQTSGWLLLPLGLAMVGIVGYNAVPALHRPWIYATTWGALPVAGGYALQTLAVPPLHVFALAGLAGALALEHLCTWGLRRCGRGPVCCKPQNALKGGSNAPCHSPTIRCATRLTMPDELNAHAKVQLRMQYAMVAGLTAWAVLAHVGL